MSLLPNRRTLRTRWSTLIWAGGVCLMAVSIARRAGSDALVDAAHTTADNQSVAAALLAEDD